MDAFDFSTNMDASYKVKIEGRLLDEEEDELDSDDSDDEPAGDDAMDTDSPKKKTKPAKQFRFSHFFKSMAVDYERGRGKDGADQSVEWKKPQVAANAANLPNAADFDQLEFKRGGDENVNIMINLVRDETPERFRLSPLLIDMLDMEEATRAEVVMAIWEYIRANGLQDDDEKRSFECDEKLRQACTPASPLTTQILIEEQITTRDKGYIPALPDQITQHLLSLRPIQLPYTIRVDQSFHASPSPPPTIYDIRVSIDDPLRSTYTHYLTAPDYASTLREIAELNNQTAMLVQAISSGKNRHVFFEGLARNPTGFLRRWLRSQKRDLEVMGGEAMRGGGEGADSEEWRRGGEEGVWGSRKARESVGVLVAGRTR